MTAKQIVEMAQVYANINSAELARRLGWSPQLLNKRLKTGKFSAEEWKQIADALGAKLLLGFEFPDGKVVD